MKKLIALLLSTVICMSVFSCTAITDWQLQQHAVALADEKMEVNSYTDHYKDDEYKAFLEKLQTFASRLTDKVTAKYGQSDNMVISPISVYMALSLACECSVGETRQEILDAVGVSYEELNKFARKLYGFSNVEYSQQNMVGIKQTVAFQQLTNSIWLDDDVEFIREGVDKLASQYNCDVYQASFKSGEAGKLINQYIENKSKGLLKGDVSFDPETYFVLMNTYYLKEIWNEYGDHLSFAPESINFQNTDGSFVSTQLLEGYYSAGKAYDGDRFSSFFTTTDHGFKIYFFVPDEEWSVTSVFTEENIANILTLNDFGHVDDENRQLHYTRVLFPEYEADFSENIAGVLSESFGINSIFDPDACNMSNITSEQVYCDGVIHKAALKVDKTGIEGAAATVMPMCGAAGPGEYEKVYHDYVVDRAFGFVITDAYGTVVFSGVINTLN